MRSSHATGPQVQPSPGHFRDHYRIEKQIGKGTYAHVFKCIHNKNGQTYAVKVVDKSKAGPKDIEDTTHEINMMARIGRHKNVVRMVEYFSTAAHLYIVMDLLDGGMLFDRIVKLKHYSEKSAVEVVRHVLEALAHIHSVGVIHRDLKPENLLLPHSPADERAEVTDVCIADFGLATVGSSTVCCGSPSYIAPEVIMRGYYKSTRDPYNEKCDIWSVGIITYALLSGRLPFSSSTHQKIFARVVEGKWSFTGSAWANVSSLAREFVKKCLEPNPNIRLSAKELLNHPWLVQPKELPDVHLGDAQKRMRELCEKRVRAAVRVFALAKSWLDMGNDERPPFMRYLRHKDVLSTAMTHQSQTDTTKEHVVDFGIPMERRKRPGFRMQDCCTCTSESVCRHVQNVHEYLFVGKRNMDVPPLFEGLKNLGLELEYKLMGGNQSQEVKEKLIRVLYVIEAACVFSKCLSVVPPEQLKSNFMVSPARLSARDAEIGRQAAERRRCLEQQMMELRPEFAQRVLSSSKSSPNAGNNSVVSNTNNITNGYSARTTINGSSPRGKRVKGPGENKQQQQKDQETERDVKRPKNEGKGFDTMKSWNSKNGGYVHMYFFFFTHTHERLYYFLLLFFWYGLPYFSSAFLVLSLSHEPSSFLTTPLPSLSLSLVGGNYLSVDNNNNNYYYLLRDYKNYIK
eukprot:gene10296-7198_t